MKMKRTEARAIKPIASLANIMAVLVALPAVVQEEVVVDPSNLVIVIAIERSL
jgi:hypothetical protein